MKKKDLILATFLPLIFGGFGLLYSSKVAGILCIIFSIIISTIFIVSNNLELLCFFYFILYPFTVIWSLLLSIKKNELIDSNEHLTDDIDTKIVNDALIGGLLVLFITFGIVAIISILVGNNSFSSDLNTFFALIGLNTILISVLMIRKQKTSKII